LSSASKDKDAMKHRTFFKNTTIGFQAAKGWHTYKVLGGFREIHPYVID
jgi:hypothetical protein